MTRLTSCALALCCAFAAAPAQAGIFGDDLTRCVVGHASDTDKSALMSWMFAAFATNPAVKAYSSITDAQRAQLNKGFVTLTERLLLSDCRTQAVAAVKNEGQGVIQEAFRVLGEIAARGLMSSPEAAKSMSDFETMMDKQKWEAFGKDAGVPVK